MGRRIVCFVIMAVCLLVWAGCAQNMAPTGGKTVKVGVPNLMSG